MRHCTGLHNKSRHGKGTYSRKRKRENADRYGEYKEGIQKTPDRIVHWTWRHVSRKKMRNAA